MTDYIPTTEEVKESYIDDHPKYEGTLPVYGFNGESEAFDRWLEQVLQTKELEVREKVAQEIEGDIFTREQIQGAGLNYIDFVEHEKWLNVAAAIARGDSK